MQIHYGPKYYSIIVRIMLLVKANLAYSAIRFPLSGNKLESIYLSTSKNLKQPSSIALH